MRKFDTKDEAKVITAVAGVLQDLGFVLGDSETEIGLVAASKNADATDRGQVAGAFAIDLLNALGGGYSNASGSVDAVQKVRASVVVRASLDGNGTMARVTFQRIVWNKRGEINRVETVNDVEIYEKFFSLLSKAIFLEGQKI